MTPILRLPGRNHGSGGHHCDSARAARSRRTLCRGGGRYPGLCARFAAFVPQLLQTLQHAASRLGADPRTEVARKNTMTTKERDQKAFVLFVVQ